MVKIPKGVGSWEAATKTTDTGELQKTKRAALYQRLARLNPAVAAMMPPDSRRFARSG